MKPLELYIHIPFCLSKCNYCDFLSAVSTEKEREAYVESLCRSIRSYGELAEAYQVVTIFVGGGTPSVLEEHQMEQIFSAVRSTFAVTDEAEITIEMNPGTVTREKLFTYKKIGINRLSIGLQTADNEALRQLGRIHTYEDFLQTYRLAREEGFGNINVDLIAAIPNQTRDEFERTLHTVAEAGPEHLSVYSLIIEEGTPFYEKYGNGENAGELPDEEEERAMYECTQLILNQYGYHRYEISNYARTGYECRHNLGYWERCEYLGIGKGAASLIDNRRFTQGEAVETLSAKEQMEEFMFLGLRKMSGISAGQFQEIFGVSIESVYQPVLSEMIRNELLQMKNGRVFLTEKGIHISNYVMSQFLL